MLFGRSAYAESGLKLSLFRHLTTSYLFYRNPSFFSTNPVLSDFSTKKEPLFQEFFTNLPRACVCVRYLTDCPINRNHCLPSSAPGKRPAVDALRRFGYSTKNNSFPPVCIFRATAALEGQRFPAHIRLLAFSMAAFMASSPFPGIVHVFC